MDRRSVLFRVNRKIKGALQKSAAKQKHQLGPKRTWLVLSFALSYWCETKPNARSVYLS